MVFQRMINDCVTKRFKPYKIKAAMKLFKLENCGIMGFMACQK